VKYQILVPAPLFYQQDLNINNLYQDYLNPKKEEILRTRVSNDLFFIPLFSLYNLSKVRPFMWHLGQEVFPTTLFVYDKQGGIVSRSITDVLSLKTVYDEDPRGLPPVRIHNVMKKDYYGLSIIIGSDCFYPELHPDNEKVSMIERQTNQSKDEKVDNSELSYLNTPRFNSFLRDLFVLCEKFGGEVTFENFLESDPQKPFYVIAKGILIDGEVLYYEDVEDILEQAYKIN
jgi:hypothetical protein